MAAEDSGYWAEGIVGESWYEHELKPADDADATFVCARLITAYRFGGLLRGEAYIEPYGMVSALDPDAGISSDIAFEEVLGVNVGFWDIVRLGLQGEVVRVGRNFPRAVSLGRLMDRTALVLQAGVQF